MMPASGTALRLTSPCRAPPLDAPLVATAVDPGPSVGGGTVSVPSAWRPISTTPASTTTKAATPPAIRAIGGRAGDGTAMATSEATVGADTDGMDAEGWKYSPAPTEPLGLSEAPAGIAPLCCSRERRGAIEPPERTADRPL